MTSATTLHSEDLSSEDKELVPLKRLDEEVADHRVGEFVLKGDIFTLDPVSNEEVYDVDISCALLELVRPLVASTMSLRLSWRRMDLLTSKPCDSRKYLVHNI